MTFPLKFVFSTVMYFSAKRRFNPGTSDSQLSGESSNKLLFMVGTPIIFSSRRLSREGFIISENNVVYKQSRRYLD